MNNLDNKKDQETKLEIKPHIFKDEVQIFNLHNVFKLF